MTRLLHRFYERHLFDHRGSTTFAGSLEYALFRAFPALYWRTYHARYGGI